jgi:hypothetical protein
MYVDSLEQNQNSYTFNGWIFSEKGKISMIKVGEKRFNKFSERKDVKEFYPNIENTQIGFSITIDGSELFEPIVISMGNFVEKEIVIESFAKWLAYYTGFANQDKGLIVVDNFYNDPDFVREWAIREIKFSPSNYHKGERATSRFSIVGMKERLEEIIGKPIYNWNHDSYANGIFQFCTADQPIVYHVDNQTYAGMVFLTPNAPPSTGTAFYRSKVTGDYKFDDEKRSTVNYVRAFQGKNAEMNFYDGTHFEKIDEVGNVYNRLVLFDAKNIHAATQYFGDAIDNARFFHMFFFDV